MYELPAPPPPFCPRCRYDLRGTVSLSGARCPECGAALRFDELGFPGCRRMDLDFAWRSCLGPVAALAAAGGLYLVIDAIGANGWYGPWFVAAVLVLRAVSRLLVPDLPARHELVFALVMALILFCGDWTAQAIAGTLAGGWLGWFLPGCVGLERQLKAES